MTQQYWCTTCSATHDSLPEGSFHISELLDGSSNEPVEGRHISVYRFPNDNSLHHLRKTYDIFSDVMNQEAATAEEQSE